MPRKTWQVLADMRHLFTVYPTSEFIGELRLCQTLPCGHKIREKCVARALSWWRYATRFWHCLAPFFLALGVRIGVLCLWYRASLLHWTLESNHSEFSGLQCCHLSDYSATLDVQSGDARSHRPPMVRSMQMDFMNSSGLASSIIKYMVRVLNT